MPADHLFKLILKLMARVAAMDFAACQARFWLLGPTITSLHPSGEKAHQNPTLTLAQASPSVLCSSIRDNKQRSREMQQFYSLPNPAGLFCAKALFWDEKRPPPVLVVPNRLLEVPVDVPNPKPVLVEEVAG